MLFEDSKKLELEKKNQLNKADLKAFQARKKRLKDEMVVDFDTKPKKKARRPKGSIVKKQ
jgi:hypothetical protein